MRSLAQRQFERSLVVDVRFRKALATVCLSKGRRLLDRLPAQWDMRAGLRAAGREVILYRYRCCASSTSAPRTLIEDMADDAAEVIRAPGLSKVDVVGFSLGGMVAQELTGVIPSHPQTHAARHPAARRQC